MYFLLLSFVLRISIKTDATLEAFQSSTLPCLVWQVCSLHVHTITYSCKNSWYIEENCAIIVFGLLQKTVSQLYEFSTDSQKSAKLGRFFVSTLYTRGLQPPGHRLVHGLLGTRLHSRSWVASVLAMLQLYLQLLAIACITTGAPPSIRSVVALDSHRSVNTNFKVKVEYPEIATNRNKVYNECSELKSSRNHPFHPGPWKNCRPWNQPLVPKRLGTAVIASGSWYYFVVFGHQQKICWLNILIGKVGFLVYYVKYILLIKQNNHRMIEKGNEWCHSRNIYNRWNVISLSNVWYAEEPEGKMFFWKIRAENAWCWNSYSLLFSIYVSQLFTLQ